MMRKTTQIMNAPPTTKKTSAAAVVTSVPALFFPERQEKAVEEDEQAPHNDHPVPSAHAPTLTHPVHTLWAMTINGEAVHCDGDGCHKAIRIPSLSGNTTAKTHRDNARSWGWTLYEGRDLCKTCSGA